MWSSILVNIFQENLEPPVDHLPKNSWKLALRQQNLTWSNSRNNDIRIGADQTQWDTLCINDKLHIQIQPSSSVAKQTYQPLVFLLCSIPQIQFERASLSESPRQTFPTRAELETRLWGRLLSVRENRENGRKRGSIWLHRTNRQCIK